MLDAGLPFRKLMELSKFKATDVQAALITHEHQDHAKAVEDLMLHGVDCWMSLGTAMALGIPSDTPRLQFCHPGELHSLGDRWEMGCFHTTHDSEEPLGFIVQRQGYPYRLMYLTDSATGPSWPTGITHLMIEVNHTRDLIASSTAVHAGRAKRSHMGLEYALRYIDDLRFNSPNLFEVHFIHLSDCHADQEEIETAAAMALPGVRIKIGDRARTEPVSYPQAFGLVDEL